MLYIKILKCWVWSLMLFDLKKIYKIKYLLYTSWENAYFNIKFRFLASEASNRPQAHASKTPCGTAYTFRKTHCLIVLVPMAHPSLGVLSSLFPCLASLKFHEGLFSQRFLPNISLKYSQSHTHVHLSFEQWCHGPSI